jgi:hypothetical protein
VPDGVFNAVGDTLELISGPKRTYRDLERLAALLRSAQAAKLSPRDAAELLRTEAPEFKSIGDELYAFLSMLIAAIAILVSHRDSESEKDQVIQNINIEQLEVIS